MHWNILCISGDEMPETSNFHIQLTADLYTQSEIDDFICDIRNTVIKILSLIFSSLWSLNILTSCL